MNKRKSALLLIVVAITSIFGVFFVYPTQVGSFIYRTSGWKLGLDLVGGTYLTYKIDLSHIQQADKKNTVEALRDVIENRVNSFGVKEPKITISNYGGNSFLNVELAGIKNASKAIAQIGKTPFLQFYEEQTIKGVQKYIPTKLTGRYVKGAQIQYDPNTGRPYIGLKLKGDGIKMFADLTEKNIGKPLAIFIDGKLLSAPIVQEKISGGSAQITGDFTAKETINLVRNINIGALPAPIHLLDQQTIGASMGTRSLHKSMVAGIIGAILVALFMIMYYKRLGIVAVLALFVYVILTMSIFKLFVTMTLAGIAGFILSIGSAVDANILIFERTKEELRKGMTKAYAMREGFKRAWPSIRDSNVSTMITTLILFYNTSSFVKGLALTLFIGVIVSMFTAVVVTYGIMNVLSKKES